MFRLVVDPDERFVVRPFSSVATLLFINTDYVKPEEMRSYRDLLNPKWRGKISTEDPTTTGAGRPWRRDSILRSTLRTDINESYLNPGNLPKAGVKYFDDTDWKWIITGRHESRVKVWKLLKAR